MYEVKALSSCSIHFAPSACRARNQSPRDWVFWDSRIRRRPTRALRGYITLCLIHPGSLTYAR
jgi:hypothetical protein